VILIIQNLLENFYIFEKNYLKFGIFEKKP
ncbi:MAG: hypothetical protein RLZZ292_1264, partial [Bacteroidota bacterium]